LCATFKLVKKIWHGASLHFHNLYYIIQTVAGALGKVVRLRIKNYLLI